jgi:hypothetical protein
MKEIITITKDFGGSGEIDFGIIEAGKLTDKKIIVENRLEYETIVKAEITEADNDVKMKNNYLKIPPDKTGILEFEITPKITRMIPITFKIKLNVQYIID